MAEKALYVLAGYDDKTEKHLSNIQSKLYERGYVGTHTKGIPQHITLASFSTDREAELIGLLQNLSAKITSFEVTFNHVGVFGGGKVLFIAPDCNRELLDLKEIFGESLGWMPHTTMIIDEPPVIFEALPVVMDEFSSFKGKVSALYLYEFFPARHILTVRFK